MAIRLRERIRQSLVYFRAAAAVSKPIAILMAAFATILLVSLATGIFLLGRWGYRQVVNVNKDDPAVTSPQEDKGKNTTPEPDENRSNSGQTAVDEPESGGTTAGQTEAQIPNTGASPYVYVIIFISATAGHYAYNRRMVRRN